MPVNLSKLHEDMAIDSDLLRSDMADEAKAGVHPLVELSNRWLDEPADFTSVPTLEQQAKDVFAIASQKRIPIQQAEQVVQRQQSQQQVQDKLKKGPIGFWEGVAQDWETKVPFSPVGALETADVVLSMGRLKDEKYDAPPFFGSHVVPQTQPAWGTMPSQVGWSADQQRKRDQQVVDSYFDKLAERSERGYSFWGQVGAGTSELPSFMVEFAATGGLKKIGSEAAKKALENRVKSDLAKRAAAWGTGAAARTAGAPQMVAESILSRRLSEDPENWATSIAKGWGDVFVEMSTEEAGGTIAKGLGTVMHKLPVGGKLVDALHDAWVNIKPENTTMQFLDSMMTKSGYNGIIGEIGEEKLATIMRNMTGIADLPPGYDRKQWDQMGLFDKSVAILQADIKNTPVEATVLAIPGVGRFTLGTIAGQVEKANKASMQRPEEVAKRTADEAEGWKFFDMGDEATAEQFANNLFEQLRATGADVQVERTGSAVRVRKAAKGELATKQEAEKPQEQPAETPEPTKEQALYNTLVEKADAGDEQAWQQLNALVAVSPDLAKEEEAIAESQRLDAQGVTYGMQEGQTQGQVEPAATVPSEPTQATAEEAMSNEADRAAPAAGTTESQQRHNKVMDAAPGKEPWEMTKEEWGLTLNEKRRQDIDEWNKAGAKGFPPATKVNTVAERIQLAEQVGYQLPRDADIVNRIDYHELAVRAAVAQGRPVPPEVLSDYPDLAKEAPNAPAAGQEGEGTKGTAGTEGTGGGKTGLTATATAGKEPWEGQPSDRETEIQSGQISTIAGKMDMAEFERMGYDPSEVTQSDWIALQRAERRRLGQNETGDNRNAPWVEYEEYHKDVTKRSVQNGDEVDDRVLETYRGELWADAALAKEAPNAPTVPAQGPTAVAGGPAQAQVEQAAQAKREVPEAEGGQAQAVVEPTTAMPMEVVMLFDELRANKLAYNKIRGAEQKADSYARSEELRSELAARGYDKAYIKAVESGRQPVPETGTTPAQADAMTVPPQSSEPISTTEKNYLREMGFSVADILKMKPNEAREKILLHKRASRRAGGFLRFNFNRQADTSAKIDKAMADFAKWLGAQPGQPQVSQVERVEPETLEGPWDEAQFRKDFEAKFGRPPSDEIVARTERMHRDLVKERKFVTTLKEQGFVPKTVEAQYHVRNTDALAVKAANLVREDIDAAEKMAMSGTDDNAIAVLSELIKEYSRRQAAATNPAEKSKWSQKIIDAVLRRAPVLTEAGRTVQAASIILLQTPEGLINFAAKTVEQYNKDNPSAKIPNLTSEQVSHWLDELRAIEAMPETTWKEQRAKMKRFGKVLEGIQSLVPSTWWDKTMAVIKAGLLTGLKTTGLNTSSNLMHGITETAKDIPAVGFDMVQALFTGKRTTAFVGKGWIAGFKKGWHEGWTYFQTGWSERDNIAQKLDWKRTKFDSWFGRTVLQPYTDFVFRALGAEDQPFYYGAMFRSLAGQAVAQAMNQRDTKGKNLSQDQMQAKAQELLDTPTDEMLAYAVLDAETAVFQNKTALGDIANYITRRIPGTELIIPFKRTPSSIAMQILNYTPVGAVKGILENWHKYDQRLLSQELGRAAVGTAALWLGFELFKLGLMTLDRPETERERELWKLEGREANSVKIGDKWRSLQVLGPVGSVLVIGGHLANGMRKTGSPSKAFVEAWAGGAKSFSEQTFLRGMNVAVEAITRPERSVENFTSTMAGMVVPTLLSDIARATDESERRQSGLGLQRIASRLPGLRTTLEPQVNVFGQDLPRYGGNVLEVMLDPTRPAKIRQDDVVDEIRRLYDLGHETAAPTLLGDRDGYKALSEEQNTELWRRAGEQSYVAIWQTMNSGEYAAGDDAQKAKLIDRSVQHAKTLARAEMAYAILSELGDADRLVKLIELRESGLITNEVYKVVEDLL